MFNIFGKILDSNEKEISRLAKIVEQINALEKKYQKFSDEKLKGKAEEFRAIYKKRGDLEEILPEAFAASREAGQRALKHRCKY